MHIFWTMRLTQTCLRSPLVFTALENIRSRWGTAAWIMNVCRSIISLCLTSYSRRFWCGSAKIFPLFVCCVWMCKFRHGHLNTACLPTAVLSNSTRACVCVCLRPEARQQRYKTVFCQHVSSQTNLTHSSHADSYGIHSFILKRCLFLTACLLEETVK